MSKVLELRDYQVELISKVENTFATKDKCAIGACPSSGKTFTTLSLVASKPNNSFLILPHGTTVIKDQWLRECAKMGITNATVALPQSIHRKDLHKYDYLVIDEAHEYANATMVTTIIEKVKPEHILYLTGTPSPFIKDGTTTHIVAAETLIRQGHVSDLYFGVFSTTATIIDTNRNAELDLKKTEQNKLVASAAADIEALISALIKRLTQTNFVKSSALLSKSNVTLFGTLGKTMIACNSIEQLVVIYKTLKDKNISVIASHSDKTTPIGYDVKSENMQRFQDEANIHVLLVVGRGILGYNMEHLVNVVDMTGSHNINRIYQLYARVMRKHVDHPLKYFFKLTSTADMQITKFFTNAAIHLMRHDFISKFNGKNLNEMELKVLKEVKPRKVDGDTKLLRMKNTGARKTVLIDDYFSGVVTANSILTDVWNNSDESLNEYATMRIGALLEREFNIADVRIIKNITEENLLYMLKHGKVDERIYG